MELKDLIRGVGTVLLFAGVGVLVFSPKKYGWILLGIGMGMVVGSSWND